MLSQNPHCSGLLEHSLKHIHHACRAEGAQSVAYIGTSFTLEHERIFETFIETNLHASERAAFRKVAVDPIDDLLGPMELFPDFVTRLVDLIEVKLYQIQHDDNAAGLSLLTACSYQPQLHTAHQAQLTTIAPVEAMMDTMRQTLKAAVQTKSTEQSQAEVQPMRQTLGVLCLNALQYANKLKTILEGVDKPLADAVFYMVKENYPKCQEFMDACREEMMSREVKEESGQNSQDDMHIQG